MTEPMTLERALDVLRNVSMRLRSVAGSCSGDYRAGMHRQVVEFDDARRAIDAHLAHLAQQAQAWQPIETAPKDGTPILIARAGEDIGTEPVEITEWCVMPKYHWEHVEGDTYRKVTEEPMTFWNGNGHRAIHWMPLPDPPASPTSDKEG